MFLHYLPTSIPEDERLFTAMAEEYGAEQVVYAHSRGESRFHDRIPGEKRNSIQPCFRRLSEMEADEGIGT